jgi:hypothetical protein
MLGLPDFEQPTACKAVCVCILKASRDDGASVRGGQLWWLLVVASVDPGFWAEKGTDERELVNIEPRQLDGLVIQDAVASEGLG